MGRTLCTASALRTGQRGRPKGRSLRTAQRSRHLNPGLSACPLYLNASRGLISEPPFHSPKSAPQIQSRFLGKEHRDQVAKKAQTARLCGKGWPTGVTRVAWGYTHTHRGTLLRFSSSPPHKDLTFGQKSQQGGSSQTKQAAAAQGQDRSSRPKAAGGDCQGGQAGRGLSQLCTASLTPTPPAVGGGRREQGSWGAGPHRPASQHASGAAEGTGEGTGQEGLLLARPGHHTSLHPHPRATLRPAGPGATPTPPAAPNPAGARPSREPGPHPHSRRP